MWSSFRRRIPSMPLHKAGCTLTLCSRVLESLRTWLLLRWLRSSLPFEECLCSLPFSEEPVPEPYLDSFQSTASQIISLRLFLMMLDLTFWYLWLWIVLPRIWSVTLDGVWIDRIYWTLWYSARLHFTFDYCTHARARTHTHTHTHTSVYSHVFTSRCLVATSNGGRSPSSGFPNCPRPQLPASHSNSSQRLNLSSPTHQLSHSPTN
jgi:hypothetical protein